MPDDHALNAREAEREELNAVAEALSRAPRLSRLVLFIGEKYFQGESEQLHEYNIATEVFGRSKSTFDASEDAIARVEAHRLRKRLKEFYETDGKDHAVRLSLPSGTYVPVFTRRNREDAPPSSDSRNETWEASHADPPDRRVADLISAPENTPPRQNSRPRPRLLVYGLLTLALLLAALGTWKLVHLSKFSDGANAVSASSEPGSYAPFPAKASPGAVIRLMAGYTGSPQTDSAGQVWSTDTFFHGGGSWRRPPGFIARTSDPLLFERWRTGDFFYDIPLKPGVYELHLFFSTSERSSETFSTFSVLVNGAHLLEGFEVNSDALGENIADERIFRDVSPDKDGYLHLSFTSERGTPALNALEILPGTPHKQLPIRLVTQLTSFTDHNGAIWHPDDYYMNGRLSSQRQTITGSPDPDLFGAERYGHFTYALPVDIRDRYTLVLHFAEFYFGPQASGVGGTGNRLFRVMCNGQTLLDNLDIYKEAGSLHALTKTFYHLRPSPQGKLNLTFEPIANNATISGIEVLDESP